MKELAHYQKQMSRAMEKVFAGSAAETLRPGEDLATIFRVQETKLNRAIAALNLIKTFVLPGFRYDYKTENLPFRPEDYEFQGGQIGQGGENEVYLLESQRAEAPSWALKFNHLDGGSVDQLAARAKVIKDEYEEVKSWFSEAPGLIPEEYTVIMEHPRDRRPAITTLQRYYGCDIQDLFALTEREDWPEIWEQNPELRADVNQLIRVSLEKEAETGNLIDFGGDKNLSVVEAGGSKRLVVLDPHLVSHPYRAEAKSRHRQKLDTLIEKVGYQNSRFKNVA